MISALVSPAAAGDWEHGPPRRNFDSVYRPGQLAIDAVAASAAPHYPTRPWYGAPYRYYGYYRPWYTYGYYGPTEPVDLDEESPSPSPPVEGARR